MRYSFPKEKIKVLLLENIHHKAVEYFEKEGYQIQLLNKSLDEDDLIKHLEDVRILGIRSKTQLSPRVFEEAKQLKAVGAFCIGTNQIDLDAAQKAGVAVFNAPFSNTRSVAELSIGCMIMLMRQIFEKSTKMHAGKWEKTATGSFEVRGKKLGIIGYGNIGTQLSFLAEMMGMQVYFYDLEEKLVIGNARKCETLDELLSIVDIVSLHIDGRPENDNFFGSDEIHKMKEGAIFLNMSRGFVVDLVALKQALDAKHIAGAAIDVFPEEPVKNNDDFVHSLVGLQNVILTPHIGGSTMEAQENIAEFVPSKLVDYINSGSSMGSVNFPNIQLQQVKDAHRLIHIHKNVPGMLARMNKLFADRGINVMGQYLQANEHIGYVITDIGKGYDDSILQELSAIEHTINCRVLY
jgi:D-3-phosphoglycerate dehydrogenase